MNSGTIVEAFGLTKEEAIKRALRELKAVHEEVAVETVEETPTHAIVRATLKERKKSILEIQRILQTAASAICEKATVNLASVDDHEVRFNIGGGDLALLIGGHAITLEALQTLASEIFKKMNEQRHLIVDVGNYRRRRVLYWRKEVKRWLESLVTTGKEFASGPINRDDRELVYELLRDYPGVDFRTVGEERDRHVIVFLKEGVPHAPPEPN
ncbi:MAG: hypothetical protein ACREJQ_01285 [bacterium]